MADEAVTNSTGTGATWAAELRNSTPEAIAKMPETYELLRSLADEYEAGTLPEPARQRIDELRGDFLDQASDNIRGWAEGAVPDVQTFMKDVMDAAQQYQQDRPDLDVRAGEMESDIIPLVAEPIHEAIEITHGLANTVDDVVHDAVSLLQGLVDVRRENDPDGQYAEKLQAADSELGALLADTDQAHEQNEQSFDNQHQAIDALVDFAESREIPMSMQTSRTLHADGLDEQRVSETDQADA